MPTADMEDEDNNGPSTSPAMPVSVSASKDRGDDNEEEPELMARRPKVGQLLELALATVQAGATNAKNVAGNTENIETLFCCHGELKAGYGVPKAESKEHENGSGNLDSRADDSDAELATTKARLQRAESDLFDTLSKQKVLESKVEELTKLEMKRRKQEEEDQVPVQETLRPSFDRQRCFGGAFHASSFATSRYLSIHCMAWSRK